MGPLLLGIDAFTDQPFHGNPAAVCISEEPLNDELKARLASEMNLSETAFVHAADGYKELRWFTPAMEVNLCGHATLATAKALFSQGLLEGDEHSFITRSGVLKIKQLNDGKLQLDFPRLEIKPGKVPDALLSQFGPMLYYVESTEDTLLELENEEDLLNAAPDIQVIAKNSGRGLIVTAKTKADGKFKEYDFVSRFFCPNVGIAEDPVTGSAHCVLAPYWKERLNKSTLKAYQASARGGALDLEVKGDRVLIAGQATIVYQGNLQLK